MRNKKNIENKKKFDAEGKFDAPWDDKLKFFFKGPNMISIEFLFVDIRYIKISELIHF